MSFSGSGSRTLSLLIFTNDLHRCIKYPKVYHSPDDRNVLQSGNSLSSKSQEVLAKKLNQNF